MVAIKGISYTARAWTAAQWNERHPVGTQVRYWPGARDGEGRLSLTRSEAWEIGVGRGGRISVPVVAVEGHAGGIALTHVEVQPTMAQALAAAEGGGRGVSRFDTIYALDPGPVETALVRLVQAPTGRDVSARTMPNAALLAYLRKLTDGLGLLAVEWLECQGAVVGESTFRTAVMIGQCLEAWSGPYMLVPRREVKLFLCGSTRAKDPHIREAVIGRLGVKGTRKTPGPTFGWAAHDWAAGGVALTAAAALWQPDGPRGLRVEGDGG